MKLCTILENPAPPGAVVSAIAARDNWTLRAARWSCGAACAGTIAILPGRAEFIEKYFEVIGELLSRNFDVAILDWRGQGLSGRLVNDPRKGHIDDFRAFERDLDALVEQVLEPFCRPPWFALGHSMGAAIALAKARAGRSPFARMVLTAPMIDIYGQRFGRGVRILAKALVLLGQGRRFVPGFGPKPYMSASFEGNILTSDSSRHARAAAIIEAAPELAIGDPTIGWINAAFRFMRRFEDVGYPRRILDPGFDPRGWRRPPRRYRRDGIFREPPQGRQVPHIGARPSRNPDGARSSARALLGRVRRVSSRRMRGRHGAAIYQGINNTNRPRT